MKSDALLPADPVTVGTAHHANVSSCTAFLRLSAELRFAVADLHEALEALVGDAGAAWTLADYTAWLRMFHDILGPFEQDCARHHAFAGIGVELAKRRRLPLVRRDLLRLGARPAPTPPAAPVYTGFAEALGALYVVEGATLGGRMILSKLSPQLREVIGEATAFLAGYGAETGGLWNDLKAALDRYGAEHPDERPRVVAGARRMFERFHAVMSGSP
jgi:heme oxygenase